MVICLGWSRSDVNDLWYILVTLHCHLVVFCPSHHKLKTVFTISWITPTKWPHLEKLWQQNSYNKLQLDGKHVVLHQSCTLMFWWSIWPCKEVYDKSHIGLLCSWKWQHWQPNISIPWQFKIISRKKINLHGCYLHATRFLAFYPGRSPVVSTCI